MMLISLVHAILVDCVSKLPSPNLPFTIVASATYYHYFTMSFGISIVLRNTLDFASRHPVPLSHLPLASVAKRHEYGDEIDKINNIYKLLKPPRRGSKYGKDANNIACAY